MLAQRWYGHRKHQGNAAEPRTAETDWENCQRQLEAQAGDRHRQAPVSWSAPP